MPHERTKTTIYDVARHAGVAISTVSRVLNESSDVSETTRERVRAAIEELQFRPDRTAKKLAQQQTRSLAVAVPTITTPFHNELLKGIRDSLRDLEIDLLLCDLGSSNPHRALMRFLKRGTVDGLLLTGVPVTKSLAQELKALQAPVVLVGNHHTDFDCFYWDDRAGAEGGVRHLVEQGHRRIGMIRAFSDSHIQNERVAGYRQALEAAGIPFDANLVRAGHTAKHAGFSEEAGYEAMQAFLQFDPRPTAVFASSDVQAIGALQAIHEAGLTVPHDVALVGYDDIKTSQYIGLSSVAQDMQEIGREATAILMDRVHGDLEGKPISRLVLPHLIARESSLR